MNRKIAVAALFTVVTAPAAWAGWKYTYPITVSTSGQYAQGALGSARNSSDTNQTIGCHVTASSSGSESGYCYAKDASGITGSCTTSSAALITQMRAISGDTYLRFYWDSAGACTSLFVSNFSNFEPKSP